MRERREVSPYPSRPEPRGTRLKTDSAMISRLREGCAGGPLTRVSLFWFYFCATALRGKLQRSGTNCECVRLDTDQSQ